MKNYFYSLLHTYLSVYVMPEDTLAEVNPPNDLLLRRFPQSKKVMIRESGTANTEELSPPDESLPPSYVLLNGTVHYQRDILSFLEKVHALCNEDTRVIFLYFSFLWKPLMVFASRLGLRSNMPEGNWISHEDMANFLLLADFEPILLEHRVLMPLRIPFISGFINRIIAPLPFFRLFNLVNILVARPCAGKAEKTVKPSVSVIIPARNESGNIESIIQRMPRMGPDDELIFVEGHSTDSTWETLCDAYEKYRSTREITIVKQPGKGKGDAVRKGFEVATKDILMIYDADMTVAAEDLPRFYHAIVSGKGEFINGSRLVYPMEKRAMRFFNLTANKFFAVAFSYILGQRFKDTLCGTKVISRENYLKIARHRSYFGELDPFGDFDLIFGAVRLCLKIVEVPVAYRERTYGTTNISRWRHGVLLSTMLYSAARKIKFI